MSCLNPSSPPGIRTMRNKGTKEGESCPPTLRIYKRRLQSGRLATHYSLCQNPSISHYHPDHDHNDLDQWPWSWATMPLLIKPTKTGSLFSSVSISSVPKDNVFTGEFWRNSVPTFIHDVCSSKLKIIRLESCVILKQIDQDHNC